MLSTLEASLFIEILFILVGGHGIFMVFIIGATKPLLACSNGDVKTCDPSLKKPTDFTI